MLVSDYLAVPHFATTLCDHRLLFHGLQLSATTLHWLITEQYCSQVELKSTVCKLPQWAKQQGYQFIGKTLLATWSSLCSKWLLRSCTNIIIKRQCSEWQASLKAALVFILSQFRNGICSKKKCILLLVNGEFKDLNLNFAWILCVGVSVCVCIHSYATKEKTTTNKKTKTKQKQKISKLLPWYSRHIMIVS